MQNYSKRNNKRNNKRNKNSGGSLASDNVTRFTHKSCSVFKYPSKVQTVMQEPGVQQAYSTQNGGGYTASSFTQNWFYTTFVPFLTTECLSKSPDSIVSDMQHLWNTQNPYSKLSKRVATNLLREFVIANQYNSQPVAYQYAIPLHWMNKTLPTYSKKYNMVGGGKDGQDQGCTDTTNYAPYNYDNYDRWRGNLGASVPIGASIPTNPFQNLYNWFEGNTTLFTPGNSNPTTQNQVNYTSQAPANMIQIGTLQKGTLSNLPQVVARTNNGVTMPTIGNNTTNVPIFPNISNVGGSMTPITRVIPFARAGGRQTRKYRRLRRYRKNKK